jgi:ComF family protein
LLWQIRCANCRRSAPRALCQVCWQQIPVFPREQALISEPWPHYAYGPYQGLLRQLLGQTKYHQRAALARALGFYLGHWFKEWAPTPAGVVPIPLHADRYKERGYNQAEEMALGVAEALQIPCFPWLIRTQATPALHKLSPQARAQVLKDSFVWQAPPLSWKKPKGPLLLVDDIFTTGATLNEARSSLPQALQGSSLSLGRTEEIKSLH